ncbi:MAG: chemotaxis protein CheA [Bacteroidales bacterium]|nr:chemotaxis protein CheA [Bacteroidales bacterium]
MIDKFRAKFVEESTDNIHDMEEALLLLEKDMRNKELIERIFRAMHSLKGGGAMFGFNHLSEFTHHLETIFDYVRNGKTEVSTDLITLTFSAIDQINFLLKTGDLTKEEDLNEQKIFVKKLQDFISGSGSPVQVAETKKESFSETTTPDKPEKSYLITFIPHEDLLKNGTNPFYLLDDLHAMGKTIPLAFTNKIPSLDLLDLTTNYCYWQVILSSVESINEIRDVFIFVEDECELNIDLISEISIIDKPEAVSLAETALRNKTILSVDDFKHSDWARPLEIKDDDDDKKKSLLKEHKISSIRVSSHKIDELVTLVSEMVTIQAQLSLYAENSGDPAIVALTETIQKLTRQLRDNAFDVSLIPLQNELMRFQRLVRDLSKEQKKDVDFIIEGGDLELDKNIIEHLTDPLLHILRNSIDHGIELPQERIAAGKSPKGTIIFKAFHSGANVIVEISDDGKGIDPEFIKQKAISKGLIDADTILDKKDTFDLLFISGFSTRDTVSGVSGRGVGMDVVRRKIANIRGEVSLESEKGKGTIISIRLPLTLSIIDGLLVMVGHNQYVIPISAIEKIFAFEQSLLKNTFNNVVVIDNEQIPYVSLREIFNMPKFEENKFEMVMIRAEDRKLGVIVDSVVGEYQTVVKPMGRYMEKQEIISGASIMGDGTISMVIDTSRLFQSRKARKVVVE